MEERKEEGEAEIQEHGPEHWFSKWERQCLAEAEQDEQLPPELQEEAAAAAQPEHKQQKLWHLFQNSATAVAQLYKGEGRRRRHLGPLQRGHRSHRPLRRQRILNLAIAGRRVRGRGGAGGGLCPSRPRTASRCYSSRRGNLRLCKSVLCLSVAVTTPNYLVTLVPRLISPRLSCAARLRLNAHNPESTALLHAFVQQYFPTWSGGRTPSLQRIAII